MYLFIWHLVSKVMHSIRLLCPILTEIPLENHDNFGVSTRPKLKEKNTT